IARAADPFVVELRIHLGVGSRYRAKRFLPIARDAAAGDTPGAAVSVCSLSARGHVATLSATKSASLSRARAIEEPSLTPSQRAGFASSFAPLPLGPTAGALAVPRGAELGADPESQPTSTSTTSAAPVAFMDEEDTHLRRETTDNANPARHRCQRARGNDSV